MLATAPTAYQSDEERHIDFKVHLVRRSLSQRRIARALGISVVYLNQVIRGRRKGVNIRKRLVSEFGIPPELVGYTATTKQVAS